MIFGRQKLINQAILKSLEAFQETILRQLSINEGQQDINKNLNAGLKLILSNQVTPKVVAEQVQALLDEIVKHGHYYTEFSKTQDLIKTLK